MNTVLLPYRMMNMLLFAAFISSLCLWNAVYCLECDVHLEFVSNVSWIDLGAYPEFECNLPSDTRFLYTSKNYLEDADYFLDCLGDIIDRLNSDLTVDCFCTYDSTFFTDPEPLYCTGFKFLNDTTTDATVTRNVVWIALGVVIFVLLLALLHGIGFCIILYFVLRRRKSDNVPSINYVEMLALKSCSSVVESAYSNAPVCEPMYAAVKFTDYDYVEVDETALFSFDAYEIHIDELYQKIRETKPVNINDFLTETIEDQISHIRTDSRNRNRAGTVSCVVVPTQEQRNSRNFSDYVSSTLDYPVLENAIGETYSEPSGNVGDLYCQMSKQKLLEINRDTLSVMDKLGSGEYGVVSRGVWASPVGDLNVALKVVNKDLDSQTQTAFLQEAAILGQFSHPNILRLVGVVTLSVPNMIVTELMQEELRRFLVALQTQHNQDLDYQTVAPHFLSFSRQVANGMQHLAERGCIHRDIAARNILLTDRCVCKIADFGMSRRLEAESDYYRVKGSNKLPVKWTAPEAVFFKRYTLKSDVWSYGMLLYEIWSVGRKPWPYEDNRSTVEKMARGVSLPPPAGCPRAVYEVMVTAWNPTADQRPDMRHLVTLLSQSDETLLDRGQLVSEAPAFRLGADPIAAEELYKDLQNKHLNKRN